MAYVTVWVDDESIEMLRELARINAQRGKSAWGAPTIEEELKWMLKAELDTTLPQKLADARNDLLTIQERRGTEA